VSDWDWDGFIGCDIILAQGFKVVILCWVLICYISKLTELSSTRCA